MVLRDQLKKLSLMRLKIGIHAVQAVLTVICWILTIAVIAKPGTTDSPIYWNFALTWFTFVALAYQALIPLWQRTRRFRNIYVCLAIDVCFSVFWLSSFAALQVWTTARLPNPSKGYCKGFDSKYGDEDRCALSNGSVILGVIIFLLFLVTSGFSGYRVWVFRKTGYLHCITKKPSISAPVQPKFVYPEASFYSGDPEKGPAITVSTDGSAHAGRKLSWGMNPPVSAPACAPEFSDVQPRLGDAKPSFREIRYDTHAPSERSPLRQYPPISRRPVTNFPSVAPPRLQLYGPGDRTPALVVDYGATTPYLPPSTTQHKPHNQGSLRYSRQAYPVTPAPRNYRESSFAPGPYQAQYGQNPYYNLPVGSHQSFINNSNYQPNYSSVVAQGFNYDQFNRRASRTAGPGPASRHQGGHHSAFHTPLPDAMMSPTNQGYHRFKRESTVQFYSQQQAFEQPDRYGR